MSEFLNLSNYPKDWKVQYGSEILTLGSGVSPSNVSFSSTGNTLYMKVDDFNHPDNHTYIRTTKLKFNKEENRIPLSPVSSIVIAKRGAAISKNRVRISEKVIAVDTNLMTIAISHSHNLTYFKYLLELINLTTIADTTSIPQLNNFHLNEAIFSFPPKPEQQIIASILTSVDEVIEKTEAQISKLQDLKKGMMLELLTKGIGHTDFKDSPVGQIPKEWELMTAQEMLDGGILLRLQDGNHGSQYPRTSEFLKRGIPYIAASYISEDGVIDFENCPKLAEKRAKALRIPPATGSDVILTHNATVGRVAIIPPDKTEVVASTSTTYYRPDATKLLPQFLANYFRSPQYQAQLQAIMGQTTRNQVPITAQKGLFFVVPSLKEQKQIGLALDSIAGNLSGTKAKHRSLLSLKKALMQDLLTGKVRVKVN